ncbi:DUF1499 domain-containing protein [Rhodobacter sp. HX-7-19]|uniref:DUF1499 domain-containing protein n=1 Tax=Paragemmobacter kunshanensis TaxID=2583234 RepID=A0A6M1U6H0_9RHOB|nr:DUF1499 domain-containing protein [Rhodobacter kunshanensis]NGQ91945.1 DUF1499 domain-containing protein [Rhodobacter kunshanensis]
MGMLLGLLALLVVGFGLYVRLAPSDPARWHVAPPPVDQPDCGVAAGEGDARAACRLALPPAEALAKLDAIATATPRTTRLAGSPEEGRITWITRSALWGFPDYTTAEAAPDGIGTRLTLHARLRFGQSDMGVNAARLQDWLSRL